MAAKKTSKKVAGKQTSPAQEALQITFVLMGNLKRAQLMYLFIARQLADVRDRSLYAALGHKDMEDYAHQRLDLGRSSLYNYLHIYDWVKQAHPEWLGKNVKGKIPGMPPEALSRLDAAINIVGNEKVMKVAGLHLVSPYQAA